MKEEKRGWKTEKTGVRKQDAYPITFFNEGQALISTEETIW